MLSTSIAISALKQFIIYIWYLQTNKQKLEVARFPMIALNGWSTHCWRAEKSERTPGWEGREDE